MATVPSMVRWAALALALALSVDASRAALRRPAAALAQQGGDGDGEGDEDKNPADSKTIDGPDCGHVKQVISHWAKAKKVGKTAGQARGTVMHAEHVEDLASKTVEKAKEIGTEAEGGEAPSDAVAKAIEEAETALSDLTADSTELSTELDTYNGKREGAEWPEPGVEEEDSTKLKDLTDKTNKAAKLVQDMAVNAMERAKKSLSGGKKAKAEATSKLKAMLTNGTAKMKDSVMLLQKAGWLVDDAKAEVTKAETAATDLADDTKVKEEVLGKDGDQKPVLEAFVETLTATKEGVTEAEGEVTAAIGELETGQAELEGILTPMKEATDNAASGDDSAVLEEADKMVEHEGKLTNFDQAVSKVQAKMETLEGRLEKLEAEVKEAESKLKPPEPA